MGQISEWLNSISDFFKKTFDKKQKSEDTEDFDIPGYKPIVFEREAPNAEDLRTDTQVDNPFFPSSRNSDSTASGDSKLDSVDLGAEAPSPVPVPIDTGTPDLDPINSDAPGSLDKDLSGTLGQFDQDPVEPESFDFFMPSPRDTVKGIPDPASSDAPPSYESPFSSDPASSDAPPSYDLSSSDSPYSSDAPSSYDLSSSDEPYSSDAPTTSPFSSEPPVSSEPPLQADPQTHPNFDTFDDTSDEFGPHLGEAASPEFPWGESEYIENPENPENVENTMSLDNNKPASILQKKFFGKSEIKPRSAMIIIASLVLLTFMGVYLYLNLLTTDGGVAKMKPLPTLNPNAVVRTAQPTLPAGETPMPTTPGSTPGNTPAVATAAPTATIAPTPNVYYDGATLVTKEIVDQVQNLLNIENTDFLYLNYQVGTPVDVNSKSQYEFGPNENTFLDSIFLNPGANASSSVKRVDFDNDGLEEIVVYKTSGKEDAKVVFAIMKINPSGMYAFSEFPSSLGMFDKIATNAFIKVGEKIFFVTQVQDQNTFKIKGINIYAAKDGILTERVLVSKNADGVISDKIYTDKVNANFLHATQYTTQ